MAATDDKQQPPQQDAVTYRALYETVSPIERRLDERDTALERRLGRIEKAMIALAVATMSPKLGGPSASDLIAAITNQI